MKRREERTSGVAAIGGVTKSMNMEPMKALGQPCHSPCHMGGPYTIITMKHQ